MNTSALSRQRQLGNPVRFNGDDEHCGRGAQVGHHLGDALRTVVDVPPIGVASFAH